MLSPGRSTLVAVSVCALLALAGGCRSSPPVDGLDPGAEALPALERPRPEPPATVTYEVAPGDTLSTIAERHATSVEAIVSANGLDEPDRIHPGDVLVIPRER